MEVILTPAIESEYLPSFVKGFRKPYLDKMYKWAMEQITLPLGYSIPGKFSVEPSQWMIPVFDALQDPDVRQVNVMGNTRGGKSLVAEIFILFCIVNNPGHILWLQSSEKSMDNFAEMRMKELIRLCPPVADLIDNTDRYAVTKGMYKFLNGMKLVLASDTIGNLQSIGYKYIVFDECWMTKQGMIGEARARLGDFPNTSKYLLISQGGGSESDDWQDTFNRGIVHEWGWKCKRCHTKQPLLWFHRNQTGEAAGICWDASAKVDEVWDYEKAANSVHLKCEKCYHEYKPLPDFRNYLNAEGEYIITNATAPNVDKSIKSFRVNALVDSKHDWGKLVKKWLTACDVADTTGIFTLKDQFREKDLAQCFRYNDNQGLLNVVLEDYDTNADWPDEKVRFLTVDIQDKTPTFWWLVRAWSADGRSRLLGYGSCNTWQELDAIRIQYKVKQHRTFVDCGNKPFDNNLYTQCAMNGSWKVFNNQRIWCSYIACKGSGKDDYSHAEGDKVVTRPYSKEETKYVSLPNEPQYKGVRGCPYILWSNLQIKTTLAHLRDGKGASWAANQVCDLYKKQMLSEELVKNPKNGKPVWEKLTPQTRNEIWDLEALQVLAATINKLINVVPAEVK